MATFLHPRPRRRPGHARSGERGAIAVLAFVVLTVLVGFAAMGFDLAYIRLARFEMKNATDAAAHAAMMLMREQSMDTMQATTAAVNVAGNNTVLGYPVVLTSSDVVFGQWDYDSSTFSTGTTPYNAVQITGHKADPTATDGTVKTTFGGPLGVSAAALTQVSVAAFRTRSLMFEMDVTGSFLNANCAMDDAIAADLAFGDAMYAARSPKDKLGLDVFVGSATPFTPLQNLMLNWTSGNNIRNDWFGDGKSATKVAHQLGLGVCTKDPALVQGDFPCPGGAGRWPNQANLKPGFPMPHCWDADSNYLPPNSTVQVYGGTNIGAGIASGIAALNASAKTYEVRSIVAFTDGGPLCCEAPGGGAICPQPGPCCADVTAGSCTDNGTGACGCSAAVRDYGIHQADLARDAGIDVYVLAFGSTPGWINYAHSLKRGRGIALDTNDKTQLKANLTKIADAIPIALVK
jgi:Flp pilus assembly protein TadG